VEGRGGGQEGRGGQEGNEEEEVRSGVGEKRGIRLVAIRKV
jgi:hypothetical protein